MTEPQDKPNIDRLIDALNDKIDYFRLEYKMTYAEVVGALEIMQHDIMHELDRD